jgi:cytochrome c oxidase cbb3-type subunit 2/cytochrome c oxidase cbb3-type subunit I/II
MPHFTETFPMIKPATNSAELAADLGRGADLFKQDCAACHGATGGGDGFIGQVLLRKPANLAATRFSTDFLSRVLWNGVRGTSMPSWHNLSQNDLRAVSAYVQTLHAPSKSDDIARAPTERAKDLFQKNCAPCHGVHGDGESALAATLIPPPANFKRMQPDADLILQLLRDGIPGTAMPSWKEQLPESDRAAIADFVRSLYEAVDSGVK